MTEIEICNRALDHLGADSISSLVEGTKAANLCARNYPIARDAVLRASPWNTAMRRAALPALTTAPAWGFAYQYQVPADCLTVTRLEDEDAIFRVEGRQILTDEGAPLNILYIARITDTAQFDPALCEAIAARLASDIAYAVTGSATMTQTMLEVYERVLREARGVDAQEGTPETFDTDEWLRSRY